MNPASERARIFHKVLEFVNHGDWFEEDGFLIFGADAYYRQFELEPEDSEGNSTFDMFLRKFASASKNARGTREISKRISLAPVDPNSTEGLKSFYETLTERERSTIERKIEELLEEEPLDASPQVYDTPDAIDARLAAEAIEQLEGSYRRLLALDEVSIQGKPFDGAEYFEEAHRCDLSGRKIAAAVLCRAVLERALATLTDSDGWIRDQISPGSSYIQATLLQAARSGIIDHSRYTAGILVRDAGNAAIHDLDLFYRKYEGRIPEIIDSVRKIVEDLFRS